MVVNITGSLSGWANEFLSDVATVIAVVLEFGVPLSNVAEVLSDMAEVLVVSIGDEVLADVNVKLSAVVIISLEGPMPMS